MITSRLIYSNIQASLRPAGRQGYLEIYHVNASSSDTLPLEVNDVWTSTGLPQPGGGLVISPSSAPSSETKYLWVASRSARSLDPNSIWEVSVTYQESPKDIPAVVNVGTIHKPYPVWADNNNATPRNVVGDIFMPPLNRTRAVTSVEISLRVPKATFDGTDWTKYADHKNGSESTTGGSTLFQWTDGDGKGRTLEYAKDTLFLDTVRAVNISEPFTHYQLTLGFLADSKVALLDGQVNGTTQSYSAGDTIGWKHEIPNAGPQYTSVANDFSTINLHAFQDGNGVCLNGIGLLKVDGTRCTAMDQPTGILVDDIPNASFTTLLDDILIPLWDAPTT
jgi:hypothetical protein